ncbi:unnamed protein product [Diplocarpon coronariae]|nr:hypothetical protein JHW43_009202 [Diplocarpon mali]
MRSSLKHCHEPDVGKDCRSLTAPEKHAYVSAVPCSTAHPRSTPAYTSQIPGAFGITHSMAELMVGVAATGSRGPGDGFCRLPGRLMRAQRTSAGYMQPRVWSDVL